MRLCNEEGDVHCVLIMAKSRVSKVITIPRLELRESVVSVKAVKLIREQLSYTDFEEYKQGADDTFLHIPATMEVCTF